MAVHYIEPTQLALMLKGPDRKSVVVIDVRDDDFNLGGHINGALNVSAHLFADPSNVSQIIKHCCGKNVEKVVVHCMMSEVRAPRVARKLADALHKEGRVSPNVLVLRRGFNTFGSMFRADPELVTTEFPEEDPMENW